jgi:hypothetical protein
LRFADLPVKKHLAQQLMPPPYIGKKRDRNGLAGKKYYEELLGWNREI